MGFSTTSKGLIKPNNDNSTPADVSQLNTNFDRVDAYGMGAFLCTSTTRPTGADRWDGQIIKETDTKMVCQWDAALARWLPLSDESTIITRTTALSIVSGTTIVSFTGTIIDPRGLFSIGTDATKIVIKEAGMYKIESRADLAPITSGVFFTDLIKNGGSPFAASNLSPQVGSSLGLQALNWDSVPLVAGDYIQMRATQSSGGNVNLTGARLLVRRIG